MTRRPAKRSKYGAQPTVIDGIRFASKKEARRYGELKLLEKAGRIKNLEIQVRFPVVINSIKVCTYVADFCYEAAGLKVVEDVKGVRTPAYGLKRKLMLALYGYEIRET